MAKGERKRERERDTESHRATLAHMIREVKKSPSMLSASWRARKAGDIIQPESAGLRIRSVDVKGSREILHV
jgi:hypothetical protein